MIEINRPEIVEQVRTEFERYERAFRANDIEVLTELFWDDPRVVRSGDDGALHGPEALQRFRSARPTNDLDRTLLKTTITTFGGDAATAVAEFQRHNSGLRGCQTQTWIRTQPSHG